MDLVSHSAFLGVGILGVKVLEASGRKVLAFRFLQFSQGGPDDFARIIVAARFDQLADEALPMVSQCDVHSCHLMTSGGTCVKVLIR